MSKSRTEADIAFIEALAELLERNALTEISVRRDYSADDGLEVKLVRTPVPVNTGPPQITYATPSAIEHRPGNGADTSHEPRIDDPAQHPGAVTSPMVGTAYLLPEPGAEPFVGIGTKVSEGQTLLIIEAMKTMNHIPSPRAGVVKRILVADTSPVEYGAPLMIIE